MASDKVEYVAAAAATITLASLATSATWVAGRESSVIDNTTNKYLDYHVSGKITVGTSPTANTEIRVYAFSLIDDTNYPDVMDGTDSDETWTSAGVRDGCARLLGVIPVDSTTSDRSYPFGKWSVAAAFGGFCPPKFGLFITHNTGVNLNATAGNHAVNVSGLYETVA